MGGEDAIDQPVRRTQVGSGSNSAAQPLRRQVRRPPPGRPASTSRRCRPSDLRAPAAPPRPAVGRPPRPSAGPGPSAPPPRRSARRVGVEVRAHPAGVHLQARHRLRQVVEGAAEQPERSPAASPTPPASRRGRARPPAPSRRASRPPGRACGPPRPATTAQATGLRLCGHRRRAATALRRRLGQLAHLGLHVQRRGRARSCPGCPCTSPSAVATSASRSRWACQGRSGSGSSSSSASASATSSPFGRPGRPASPPRRRTAGRAPRRRSVHQPARGGGRPRRAIPPPSGRRSWAARAASRCGRPPASRGGPRPRRGQRRPPAGASSASISVEGPRAAAARGRCRWRPGWWRPSGRSAPPPRSSAATSAVSCSTSGMARLPARAAPAAQGLGVERAPPWHRRGDRGGGGRRDHARPGLGARQRRLEVQHALEARGVGERVLEGRPAEQRVEQAHAPGLTASAVEEDRLAGALQDDVPLEQRPAARALRDQGAAPRRVDEAQREVARRCRGSSGKYIRVTSRRMRPRANTDTARCGACGRPSGPGTGPGLMVCEPEAARRRPWGRGRSRGMPGRAACPACPPGGRTGRGRWPARSRGSASGTGAPSPSNTRPSIVTRSPGTPGGASSSAGQPGEAEGEERPHGLGRRGLEAHSLHRAWPRGRPGRCRTGSRGRAPGPWPPSRTRDQPLPRPLVRRAVEDRVVGEERVAREIHLRHQAGGEGGPEHREMDVGGPPGVRRGCARGRRPGRMVTKR